MIIVSEYVPFGLLVESGREQGLKKFRQIVVSVSDRTLSAAKSSPTLSGLPIISAKKSNRVEEAELYKDLSRFVGLNSAP
jgi:hypothetical protein